MIRYNSFDGIATIFLDRPQKAHAYNSQMLALLEKAIHETADHSVCIITSTGDRHFCAGADTSTFENRKAEDALRLHSQRIFALLSKNATVYIAAMKGAAIAGGFELALACDLRVVHPRVYASLPEVGLGLIPAAGGCTRLVSFVGPSIAKAVILGGESIAAEQGMNWGLFHRISEDPVAEAKKWAADIAKKNPLALQLAKQILDAPCLEKERLAEAILYERKFHGKKI